MLTKYFLVQQNEFKNIRLENMSPNALYALSMYYSLSESRCYGEYIKVAGATGILYYFPVTSLAARRNIPDIQTVAGPMYSISCPLALLCTVASASSIATETELTVAANM